MRHETLYFSLRMYMGWALSNPLIPTEEIPRQVNQSWVKGCDGLACEFEDGKEWGVCFMPNPFNNNSEPIRIEVLKAWCCYESFIKNVRIKDGTKWEVR